MVGTRSEILVAIDWTDYDPDNQSTIAQATHPAARLQRKEKREDGHAEEERADLLARLDAEADEDGDAGE